LIDLSHPVNSAPLETVSVGLPRPDFLEHPIGRVSKPNTTHTSKTIRPGLPS